MKRLLITITAFLTLFSFTVAPVAAHNIENDGSQARTYDNKDWQEYFKKRWDKDAFRKKAQERADEAKKKSQLKRLIVIQKVCEARKARLDALPARLSEQSQKIHNVFTKIYTRVQDFYATGQLTLSNYDELKTRVDTAQMTSAEAVLALGQLTYEVDCSRPQLAEQFASLRETAKETKQTLKDYRKELVNLISALRAEAAENNNEPNAENQ